MTNKKLEYKVGYKKPPEETRFKPGKSGNSKGRPRGSKNLSNILLEEAETEIPVLINGKKKRISVMRASIKRLFQSAMEGKPQAMAKVVEIARLLEKRRSTEEKTQDLSQTDEEIIKEFFDQHREEDEEKS